MAAPALPPAAIAPTTVRPDARRRVRDLSVRRGCIRGRSEGPRGGAEYHGDPRGQLNIAPASDRQLARLPSVRNQDASLSRGEPRCPPPTARDRVAARSARRRSLARQLRELTYAARRCGGVRDGGDGGKPGRVEPRSLLGRGPSAGGGRGLRLGRAPRPRAARPGQSWAWSPRRDRATTTPRRTSRGPRPRPCRRRSDPSGGARRGEGPRGRPDPSRAARGRHARASRLAGGERLGLDRPCPTAARSGRRPRRVLAPSCARRAARARPADGGRG